MLNTVGKEEKKKKKMEKDKGDREHWSWGLKFFKGCQGLALLNSDMRVDLKSNKCLG